MSHEAVLRQLMPLELGGDHDIDLGVEGRALDALIESLSQLRREMFPDTCVETLADWERVYGLTPAAADPVPLRRDRLLARIRHKGGLSKRYFMALAESLGYTIEIEEHVPFMFGWSCFGDTFYAADMMYCWEVTVHGEPYYAFRFGESCFGDPLGYTPDSSTIEGLFDDLKPAHTTVVFKYV